ncbi:MAG: hypothetical protein SGPRY_003069, partial [Prymnesium sp.]
MADGSSTGAPTRKKQSKASLPSKKKRTREPCESTGIKPARLVKEEQRTTASRDALVPSSAAIEVQSSSLVDEYLRLKDGRKQRFLRLISESQDAGMQHEGSGAEDSRWRFMHSTLPDDVNTEGSARSQTPKRGKYSNFEKEVVRQVVRENLEELGLTPDSQEWIAYLSRMGKQKTVESVLFGNGFWRRLLKD